MTIIVILILLCIPNIIVETIYIPSAAVSGMINIQSLLKQYQIPSVNTSQDSYLNITQLVSKYGYVLEEHTVTTEDGYILGLHRLTRVNNSNYGGISVFLMHGLMDSSDSWILQGPNSALGYILIDAGFDVWMGNARGNKHSSAHVELNPNQDKFWKFSWEQIGRHDLPAMIDYILTMTDKDSLYYVGHSQGTTSFFVMNSFKPEYKSKIKMMFALSPIAWLSHAHSPLLKYLSTIPATVLQYFQFFNTQSPTTDTLYQIYGTVCKAMATGCGSVFEMIFGNNHYVSDAMLPVIVEHASSSSVLQFVHFWQLYQSGRFCRFDYGWMWNLFEYASFSPPDYDLSDITVPIIMFFSGNDWLSHPTDVSILHDHLPKVNISYYSEYFSHIDYMYASVAKDEVYIKIIKHIRNCERQ